MFSRITCLVAVAMALMPGLAASQDLTDTESRDIAETVSRLFIGVSEATSALDLDRILALHEDDDALTYVAQGRVTRGIQAFKNLLEDQLGGLSAADVRFADPVVDVLDHDVAVATSTYRFTATFPSGSAVTTSGTYTCVFVRRDGGWKIRHSSHTFPPRSP